MKFYRRFKRRYRTIHLLIVAAAIVLFWWALWGVFDTYLLPNHPLAASLVGVIAAFVVMYFDDFHLRELE